MRATDGRARRRCRLRSASSFYCGRVWDSSRLETALLKEADRLVGDQAGFLVIDDTALPKKGQYSVGVAPQYASSLGKTSNCQSLVSVTLASREVPVMVGLRLFLPDIWTNDPERMKRARVTKDRQVALTKPEIAIEEIDRVIASGSRFGCVLADAGYGSSIAFRQALSERGLLRAVGLSRRQNVYPADVDLIFPVATSGRRRQYHIPDQPPVSATVPCHTIYASLLQEGVPPYSDSYRIRGRRCLAPCFLDGGRPGCTRLKPPHYLST